MFIQEDKKQQSDNEDSDKSDSDMSTSSMDKPSKKSDTEVKNYCENFPRNFIE